MHQEEQSLFFSNWSVAKENWSWRIYYFKRSPLTSVEMGLFEEFNLNEPWNSEHNLPLVEKIQKNHLEPFHHFFCPGDHGVRRDGLAVARSPYVAVTGPGTVWTELRNGTIKDIPWWGISDMILIIETSEPTNHWAEPGDDVSPEEVIRLFEADPGLVKNSSRESASRYAHWPKHFVTLGGRVGHFGEFPDVDALRKALIITPPPNERSRIEHETQ